MRFQWRSRYSVLTILSVSWIVCFTDRAVMAVAIPYIAADYHLSPLSMGVVLSAFFATYSISQIPGGYLSDRFGVRRVATVAMLWWSLFTAMTGAAANLTQLLLTRLAFGLGEGVFPACAFKTIAVWFPRRERGTANAIKMACGPLGAAIAPLFVVSIIQLWGWREVFYIMFVPGVIMAIVFWLRVADDPATAKGMSAAELAEIEPEAAPTTGSARAVRFREVIADPAVLKCFVALFFFDIAYWGFNTWLPTYLVKARGFSMIGMGVAASLPQIAGIAGCVLGGWASDRFFSNNRRVPIVASQIAAAILLAITFGTNSVAVLIVCQTLAGFSLNIFFTTFWAVPMTTVPTRLMGVTTGLINTAGQIAATLSPLLIGFLVDLSDGGFGLTFGLLIASIAVSCGLVIASSARESATVPA